MLVDESHRSQYGNLDSLHSRMREVLPNACFIAFTGTPIAKKEKNTFAKFGDLVQPSYSMRDAVKDKAVGLCSTRAAKWSPTLMRRRLTDGSRSIRRSFAAATGGSQTQDEPSPED